MDAENMGGAMNTLSSKANLPIGRLVFQRMHAGSLRRKSFWEPVRFPRTRALLSVLLGRLHEDSHQRSPSSKGTPGDGSATSAGA